jgi:sodium/bile acid cotransporter 7
MRSVLAVLRREWFLTSLTVLILLGLGLGRGGWGPVVSPWAARIDPRVTTAVVLFLMSVSLDSAALGRSLRTPGPVVIACLLCYGLLPLLAWGLSGLQGHPDLALGLMIAASVPSTLASASVMTRRAGGNDAVSLLATLITNATCVVVTPLWLVATTGTSVQFDVPAMMQSLLFAALLPTVLGQAVRRIPGVRLTIDRHKPAISAIAQLFIELIVLTAALRAGIAWRELALAPSASTPLTLGAFLWMGLGAAALHLVVWWIGWKLTTRLGWSEADAVGVSFSGSQKTLPVGLLVATDPATFGTSHPFAIFPMLVFHIGQLFFDSALASWLKRRSIGREIGG